MFNIGSEMSIARVATLLLLLWKVKRMLNVRLEKALKEGVKVVHELVMKGGRASEHGGESYNYK